MTTESEFATRASIALLVSYHEDSAADYLRRLREIDVKPSVSYVEVPRFEAGLIPSPAVEHHFHVVTTCMRGFREKNYKGDLYVGVPASGLLTLDEFRSLNAGDDVPLNSSRVARLAGQYRVSMEAIVRRSPYRVWLHYGYDTKQGWTLTNE